MIIVILDGLLERCHESLQMGSMKKSIKKSETKHLLYKPYITTVV